MIGDNVVGVVYVAERGKFAVYQKLITDSWTQIPDDALWADTIEEARVYLLLLGCAAPVVLYKPQSILTAYNFEEYKRLAGLTS